jgi:hypothetical protein
MKILNRFYFLFLIAALATGCDKVKVNPPDKEFEPSGTQLNQTYEFSGNGPFEFSVTGSFISTTPLTISIIQAPAKGSLQLMPKGNFLYQPEEGFSGKDSALYQVCSEQSCFKGKLTFEVSSTCLPQIPDFERESNWGLNQIIDLPSGFSCGALLRSVYGNARIRFENGVIVADLPANRIDTNFFQITGCNLSEKCDTGTVRLISGMNQCRNIFSLNRDTFRLNRNFSGVSINLNLLLANDQFCENDLDLQTLEASQPAAGSSTVRQNVQGNFIRYIKSNPALAATDSLIYRLTSKSGAQSSATLIILNE